MAESALLLSSASSFACQPVLSSLLLSFSSAQHIPFTAASFAPLADLCIRSGLSFSTAATALATDTPTTSSKVPGQADAEHAFTASPRTLAAAVNPATSTSLPLDADVRDAGFPTARRFHPLLATPTYQPSDPDAYCTVVAGDRIHTHRSSVTHTPDLTQSLPLLINHGVPYGSSPPCIQPSFLPVVGEFPLYRSALYSSYALLPNAVYAVASSPCSVQDAVAPPPSKTDTWRVAVPRTFRSRSIVRKRVGGGGSGSDGWDGKMDGGGFSSNDPWSFDGSDYPFGGGGDGFGGGWGNSGGGGGSWNGGSGGSSGGDPGAGGAGGEGGGGQDDPWWREWEQGGDGWRDADWWLFLESDRRTTFPAAKPAGGVWSLVHMWAWEFVRSWRAGAWGLQRGASLLYRVACWVSLSRCFFHAIATALAASASAPPALRRAAASILVAKPPPAPPAAAAAPAVVLQASAESAWRGSLAQCCCFSGSLILALNAAGARWGTEG